MPICRYCKEEYKSFSLHQCKGVLVEAGLFDFIELFQRRGRSNAQWASDWARALLWVLLIAIPMALGLASGAAAAALRSVLAVFSG
ncbi:MAG: hypothetical protein JSV08_04490 [Acidobacteriota bacterium]|nr:MAG: hypothetical protein JSV08_04490 [Acidobacteriota bacterium]